MKQMVGVHFLMFVIGLKQKKDKTKSRAGCENSRTKIQTGQHPETVHGVVICP